MSDLQAQLLDTLQTRGYDAMVSDIEKALPPLVLQMLAERLARRFPAQPRPGDPKLAPTTR